jgi:hypothetical protein
MMFAVVRDRPKVGDPAQMCGADTLVRGLYAPADRSVRRVASPHTKTKIYLTTEPEGAPLPENVRKTFFATSAANTRL